MTNINVVRGAALFFMPMVLASCGGSDQAFVEENPEPGLIESVISKSKPGCVDNCEGVVAAGVVARVVLTETGETAIRFATFDGDQNTGDGVFRDGIETVNFSDGVGDQGEEGGFLPVGTYSGFGTIIFEDSAVAFVMEDGFFGVNTDGDVVPVDGIAFYEGTAYIQYGDNVAQLIYDDFGLSDLTVNFGEGDADLRIELIDNLFIAEFDEIHADNMVIDGYTFTGDAVRLMDDDFGDVTADVLGANLDSASAGMFLGPVDENGNPEEFGAVTVNNGDDGYVYGIAIGGDPVPVE